MGGMQASRHTRSRESQGNPLAAIRSHLAAVDRLGLMYALPLWKSIEQHEKAKASEYGHPLAPIGTLFHGQVAL